MRFVNIKAIVAALAMALAMSGLPRPGAAAEVTLTYAFFAPASTFPGKQMDHWAAELKKRTNGKVEVQTFPGGTLLGAREMYDGVRRGVADIGLGSPAYDPGRFPLSAGYTLPLGLESATQASLTYWDVIQEMEPKEFEGYKIIALFTNEPGYIQSRRPVRSLADLKGMKLRAVGSAVPVMEALGAAPVGMPMPSVPEAVQTGVIDGVVTGREVLHDFKLAENLGYVTDYRLGVVTFAAVMDQKRWERLPDDVKKVIDGLGREMALWTSRYFEQAVERALEWSKKNHGLEILSLAPGEAREWDQRLRPIVDQWEKEASAKGLPAGKFLERVRALAKKNASASR